MKKSVSSIECLALYSTENSNVITKKSFVLLTLIRMAKKKCVASQLGLLSDQ
jgi:hypothetical protein